MGGKIRKLKRIETPWFAAPTEPSRLDFNIYDLPGVLTGNIF